MVVVGVLPPGVEVVEISSDSSPGPDAAKTAPSKVASGMSPGHWIIAGGRPANLFFPTPAGEGAVVAAGSLVAGGPLEGNVEAESFAGSFQGSPLRGGGSAGYNVARDLPDGDDEDDGVSSYVPAQPNVAGGLLVVERVCVDAGPSSANKEVQSDGSAQSFASVKSPQRAEVHDQKTLFKIMG
ncbi:hypothetical protein KC19_VG224600 [Ceratodon purpureus]|uniref:Uncharacterized protein n=1 Tax=Ceratodon purpureus TaxID=3225 RepID=A0A8T0HSP8_CERPU|nr:hypothetical protein KC19_VG224600 [Ceratodon purpureus]